MVKVLMAGMLLVGTLMADDIKPQDKAMLEFARNITGSSLKMKYEINDNNTIKFLYVNLDFKDCEVKAVQSQGVNMEKPVVNCNVNFDIGSVAVAGKAVLVGDELKFKVHAGGGDKVSQDLDLVMDMVFNEDTNSLSGTGRIKGFYKKKTSVGDIKAEMNYSLKI